MREYSLEVSFVRADGVPSRVYFGYKHDVSVVKKLYPESTVRVGWLDEALNFHPLKENPTREDQ